MNLGMTKWPHLIQTIICYYQIVQNIFSVTSTESSETSPVNAEMSSNAETPSINTTCNTIKTIDNVKVSE